jgi:tetratricopeptide (TPR) repeat protein
MFSRFPNWWILAGGLVLTTGLTGADHRKPVGTPRKAAENLAIANQLKEVFDAGFVVGPRSVQEALGRLDKVRRLAPGEPRIDYSQGLVLVKQSQMKLASDQFEAALTQAGPPLWPAWKAAIWSHFVNKQYEMGLNRLVEFSILVRDTGTPDDSADGATDKPSLTSSAKSSVDATGGNATGGNTTAEKSAEAAPVITEAQREAARWIGQLLEALALLPDSKKSKGLIEERQARALDALGEELEFSVEEGRELLRARAAELELAADAARDTAGQLAKRRKLDKEFDALDKDKGAPPQTKEEWKAWIDDLLGKFDKQLGLLDRDFQSLSQRADGLNRSYAQANAQLTAARANMPLMHRMGPVGMTMMKEQMVAYSDQMTAYQVEYNVVVGRMADVAERASGIADRRANAIARYEKETGDTIPKNPDLDKWATRLSSKRPKLATKPAAKTAKKDPADKKRVPTLKSLMPLDLEQERDGVLAFFGLRPAEPPSLFEDRAAKSDPAGKSSAKSDQKPAGPSDK